MINKIPTHSAVTPVSDGTFPGNRYTRRAALVTGAAALVAGRTALAAVPEIPTGQIVESPDHDAPDAPAVRISNGLVDSVLYLPDLVRGYYRATRFDWSGVIAGLRANGHSYFGRWFPTYDPKLHDSITGPVQEFVTGQGMDAAQPGGTFLKIGVGVLRKPLTAMPRGFPTLELVDGGTWTTRVQKNAVEFVHVVSDRSSGYGYRYRKTLSLPRGKSQLLLSQHIESTGPNPIDTDMYDHNFFVLDDQPVGPDIEARFTFPLTVLETRGEAAQVQGNTFGYTRLVDKPVRLRLGGFGTTSKDYDIRVENKKTRAGVRVTSNQPLTQLVYWTSPRCTCPEPYMRIRASHGRPTAWTITYDFYERPDSP
jgi:hypothetical protein